MSNRRRIFFSIMSRKQKAFSVCRQSGIAPSHVQCLTNGKLKRLFKFTPRIFKNNRGLTEEKEKWLPDLDSNQDKLNQNQLCYHYTIGQGFLCSL